MTAFDRKLDEALELWPGELNSETFQLDAAAKIVARLEAGDVGTTAPYIGDDNLFTPPNGDAEGTRHNWPEASLVSQNGVDIETPFREIKMTTADRERDRQSLQDLAKMAKSKPSVEAGDAKGEDSGLIRLAAFFEEVPSEPTLQSAAASTPGVPSSAKLVAAPPSARVLTLRDPHALAMPPANETSPPSSRTPESKGEERDRISIPPAAPISVAPPPHAVLASVPPIKTPSRAPLLVLGAFAGIAAAAATVFFMNKPPSTTAHVEMARNDQGAAKNEAPVTAQPAPVVKNEDPPTSQAIVLADPPTNVDSPAPKSAAGSAPRAPGVAANSGVKPSAAKKDDLNDALARSVAQSPESPTPPVAKAPPPPPAPATPGESSLSEAMRQAAGPAASAESSGDKSPQFAPGSVPQKPSQGALTGAIGAALPSARVCLGPDDPVSRATITFASTGVVQSVSVSGGAAGGAAEGCIKSALSKAKLAPFAEATYTTTVTVRH